MDAKDLENVSKTRPNSIQVFSMFGEILSVDIYDEEEFAIISFKNILNAYFAQQSMDSYFLKNHNAKLSVKWIPKEKTKDNSQAQCNPQSEGPSIPDTTEFREEKVESLPIEAETFAQN